MEVVAQMTLVRALVWLAVGAWLFIALNFGASLLWRLSTRRGRARGGLRLRLTWGLAALGAGAFLLSRLTPLPYGLRASLDVALALGGLVCAGAMAFTLLRDGLGVIR
jgi:hypothetical protein